MCFVFVHPPKLIYSHVIFSTNAYIGGFSYVMAKNILVLPILLLFSVFSVAIPAFGIMDFPIEGAKRWFFLWAAMYFNFEAVAEVLSVVIDDAVLGMMAFMNFYCKITFVELYLP